MTFKTALKKILPLIMASSMSACVLVPHSEEITLKQPVTSRVVTVVKADPEDIAKACPRASKTPLFHACATWTQTHCTIYVPEQTYYTVLGHELRHCLEGHFHDF